MSKVMEEELEDNRSLSDDVVGDRLAVTMKGKWKKDILEITGVFYGGKRFWIYLNLKFFISYGNFCES